MWQIYPIAKQSGDFYSRARARGAVFVSQLWRGGGWSLVGDTVPLPCPGWALSPPKSTGHHLCTLGPYQAALSWKTLISSKPKFAKTQIWQSLKIFPAKASLLELLLCGFVGKMCAQEQFLHISRTLRSFCDLMFCAKISQHFDKVWDGFLTKRW